MAAAGNAAIARRMNGSRPRPAGPVDPRVVTNPLAGNRAISRALAPPGGAANAAPSGFAERLGSAEAGQPIPDEARESLESAFGTSLGPVRLHVGSRAAELAAEVNANAFTVGRDIYFAQGQYQPDSERGYQLLAHEVTHTLQPGGDGAQPAGEATVTDPADASEREAEDIARRVAAARTGDPAPPASPDRAAHSGVQRDVSATDVIPDFILNGVKSAITAIPGYAVLTYITGKDPLTDEPVHVGHQELVEKLLTYGPFGAGVGQVLRAADVLGDVYTMVTSRLGEHHLTLARIEHDIGAAWDELSITNGIDGNVAIVRRYVNAILDDVGAFVRSIVDQVIEKVRAVVADVAEPHLQTPQVKPVWDLARKVLHYDPLRGQEVSAPTVEILADFLRLIGKEQVLAQLTERGTLQQTAEWLDTQFATFVGIKNDLLTLFRDAWAAIQPQNLPNLLSTLPSLAQRAFALVQRIAAFAGTVIGKVLELIKKSLLGWLSSHAYEIPGFRLLTVMIERNPFTGDAVARTPENLIGGFIALLPNGEATYRQLAESGVIAEAAGRITSAMTRLGITVELITSTFQGIWNTLSLEDLLAPVAAFERVLARFREPLARIAAFVSEVVQVVISLILKLMNFPSDLLGSIINNAMQAIEDIKRDPVAFLLNMLQALKSGFIGFFDKILTYLLDGLTGWLFRGLGQLGITRPPDLSLRSILDLVLQVLGVTVEKLWQKLGQHLGPERVAQIRGAIDKLTGAWAFIKEVQQDGVAAIWRYVTDKLSGLWDTVVDLAKNWIMSEIVEKVTAKLISMLDPTGIMAVVNSFIAFFNAIQSAIEYLRDILEIVNQYVTTFAQVAAGNIIPGAAKVTQGLANAVPIAIGFLANQVGIGNVPEKVVEIIGGLRDLIDEAMDWLIQNAISLGQSALTALGFGGPEGTPPAPGAGGQVDEHFTVEGEDHHIYVDPRGALMIASTPTAVSDLEQLRGLYAQFQALPPTATAEERRPIVAQMVQLVKSDPTLLARLAEPEPVRPVGAAAFHGRVVAAVRELAAGDVKAGDAQQLYETEYAKLERNPGKGKNDELLVLLPAVWRALRDPDSIADAVTDVWVESQLLGKIAPEAAVSTWGAAAMRLSRSTGANVVILPRGKKLFKDGQDFYEKVVLAGHRFLDLNVLDISGGHGATTHMIQDLVVDRALRGVGVRSEQLRAMFRDAIGDNDERIGRWLWETIFDSLQEGVNDPNKLWPVLSRILPGLE